MILRRARPAGPRSPHRHPGETAGAAAFCARARAGAALGALALASIAPGPAAAQSLSWLGGAGGPAGPLSAAHLFAGLAGAAAVATGLAALALWRRHARTIRALGVAQARLRNDLSQERVFAIVDGRLEPASPATDAFVRARFAASTPGAAASTPGAGAEVGAAASGARAGAVFDAETLAHLRPMLRSLAATGEAFETTGRDAGGRRIRVVGRSVGAKPVVRLLPLEGALDAAPEAPDPVEPPQPDAEGVAEGPSGSLAIAFDLAPAGLAVFDADGRLTASNAAFARLWRLDRAWLSERPTLRAVLNTARAHGRVPERAKIGAWLADAASKPLETLAQETLWTLADGDALRVEPHALPDGGTMLLVTDETDVLGLERRYRAAVGARIATLNTIDQGLALIGVDGRAALVNPAFGRIWGLDLGGRRRDAASLEGAPLSSLAEIAGRDARDAAAWVRIQAAVAGRSASSAEGDRTPSARAADSFTHARADGRILSIQVAPQPDGAALIVCADVTDSRRAERALAEKAAALEAADRLKSDFLNTVAGQLRTPVDTLITYAELLRDGGAGPLRKRQREHLDDMLRAANDLREVVSDALALGALKGGAALQIEESPLDLRRTLATLATAMAARARRRGTDLTAALPAEPMATLGDEARLKQAISSAIATALSGAGPGDRMALRLSRQEGREGPEARIEIALRRREAGAMTSISAISGSPFASEAAAVAVSLARRIVEAHGGRLELFEDEGAAQAALHLPIRAIGPDIEAAEDAIRVEPRAGAGG